MGDSLDKLDFSKYINNANNFGQMDFSADFLGKSSNTANSNNVETYDFSEPYTNNSTSNSWIDLATTSDSNPTNTGTIKLEEVDDFSGGQYGDYTIKQYFLSYGDVNSDGKISTADTDLIQQYLSSNTSGANLNIVNDPNSIFDINNSISNFNKNVSFMNIKKGIGDIDGDGEVTLKDVSLIQKYLADGTFEPTNLTEATRLDTLKYTNIQKTVGDDLSNKKQELGTIKDYISQIEIINDITLGPNNLPFNSNHNSEPFDVNKGNAEDYTFFKSVFDGKLDISYSNLGDRLIQDSNDPYDELKKAVFERNAGFSGTNRLNGNLELPQTYSSKDEYRQMMIKKYVNAVLYMKNNNSLIDNPNKSIQDAACDYALKHAEDIVDYYLEYGSLSEAKSTCQNNISGLKYSKKQLDKQVMIIPFDNMMKTAEFKKYANNTKTDTFNPEKNDKLKNYSKYMDSYKYLDITQLTMYNYLLDNYGENEANKYLDAYEEDINQAKGLEMANSFIDKLDKNFTKIVKEDGSLMDEKDIASAEALIGNKAYDAKYDMNGDGKLDDEDLKKLTQYIDAGGEILTTFDNLKISYDNGFWDGWSKFFSGFKYIGDDTAIMSADEYKMVFIAEKLQQNGLVSGTYEFGQTVGNMAPTMIAAALATIATSYFGGEGGAVVLGTSLSAEQVGQITAGSLIFMSTYGTSKHEASVKGNDIATAVGYGVLSGLSESSLETLLGSLPFVGKECSNVFVSMFKEGLSESAQEFVGSMIGEVMLDEEIDISELTPQMAKAFLFGALLSGMGSAGKKGIKVTFNGLKYVLTSEQLMDYYNASIDPKTGENNGLSLQEYIEENVEASGKGTVDATPVTVSAFETKVADINTDIDAEITKLDSSSPDYSQQCALLESKRAKMIELAVLMENSVVDVTDPMSNLTSDEKVEVTEYANVIHEAAVANEPKVTSDMKGLEDSSAHLVGLEHNTKSISSLESKLARKLAQGFSLDSASSDINDSLRYTLIVDEGSYESAVKTKLADLVRQGYKIEYWNDAWGGSIYQGLNVTLRSPDGILVELQFHTEDSFRVKEELNHEYYEISRNPSMDSDIVQTSNEIQKINQQLYVKNVGFGFGSNTVAEINQMAKTGTTTTTSTTPTNTLTYTNVSADSPFKSQIEAYKKVNPNCELVPGTDVPKALVISDISYIRKMGNGDLTTGLKAISKKYGEYSVQAVSARATVFQESLNQVSYSSTDYVPLAQYTSQLYSLSGLESFENTTEMSAAGLDPTKESLCNNWLSSKYSSDIDAWKKLSSDPNNLSGLHYFTGSGYLSLGPHMRENSNYTSDDISAITQLSGQLDSSGSYGLKGLGECTILYRGIDNPSWLPGIDNNSSSADIVNTINSLSSGTVVMGDNSFQSTTPILGQGFTGEGWLGKKQKPVIEVCSCPPGTEGAYLGDYAAYGYDEVEYTLQAGSGNRKIILGAKEINGQVFIFTEMVPESEVISSTSGLTDVEIDSSVQSFTSEADLQAYIKSLYSGSNPDTKLAAKTVLKYIQDKASSSGMSGALYFEFLCMYNTGLDSSQNAALLTEVINSSSDLRQAIYDGALDEMKSVFGSRFKFSDAKCQELLNTLLGENFVKDGVGAGINWENFRTEMRSAIRAKVQDGIRSGKEAVIWSGFDDETHDTMDSKYTTISNTSIGGLNFLESVYMNWNSEATPQKASTLWGIMSEEYAQACCLATDANGKKLDSIKFLYPSDTTSTGADLFGELFKSSELPQILESGTIDTIVMTETDPSDMSVVSTVKVDIKDIREYYLKYKDIPGAKGSVLKKCFEMLSKKVEEAMK